MRCSKGSCWAVFLPCSNCAIPASPWKPWGSPSERSSCCCSSTRSGVIKVTQKFRLGVVAATGGIFLFYMAQMLLGFFHISFFSSVYGSGIVGIGFSLFVVAIAALNLVLDFDFVEQGVAYGAPKYMEWYAAFGIMVTLVWLYLEILRLLAKMRSRN